MRVVLCGSAHWNYDKIVEDEIVKLHRQSRLDGKKLLVIHGGEPGPETVADTVCIKLGIDRIIHPAVRVLGDNCFYRRNQLMIQYHKPDLVIGIAHEIETNKVIYDLLERANIKGIKTKAIDYEYLNRGESHFKGI